MFNAKFAGWEVGGLLHKDLDFAGVIAKFEEGELAEGADGDDAAGDADGLVGFFVKMIKDGDDFGVAMRLGRIRVNTKGSDLFKFAEALSAIIIQSCHMYIITYF